ncbi:MAG TPA: hypothetical protein VGH87_28310, partial [Polyangiaceae bacterium]
AFVLLGRPSAAAPTASECALAAEKSLSLRKQHALRAARSELLVCASASCPDMIRDECAHRVAEVNAAIPTVVFEARDEAGRDLGAVTVTMDGAKLADRLDGTAIAIEPGEHAFTFEMAPRSAVQRSFVVREGEKDRRERIVLVAPAVVTTPLFVRVDPRPPPKTQRTIALGVGVAGVASLLAGVAFGGVAAIDWSHAQSDCGAGCGPSSPAQGERNDALGAATVANVTLVVGAVFLVTSVVLWLTAPHAASARAGAASFGTSF